MIRQRDQVITMLKTVTINYGSGSEILCKGEEYVVTESIARLLSNHGAALWPNSPNPNVLSNGGVGGEKCDDHKAMGAAPENKGYLQ
jgi:hypothetical protein